MKHLILQVLSDLFFSEFIEGINQYVVRGDWLLRWNLFMIESSTLVKFVFLGHVHASGPLVLVVGMLCMRDLRMGQTQ